MYTHLNKMICLIFSLLFVNTLHISATLTQESTNITRDDVKHYNEILHQTIIDQEFSIFYVYLLTLLFVITVIFVVYKINKINKIIRSHEFRNNLFGAEMEVLSKN